MGYVEIPKIDSVLPVYHGTADAVLQIAVGHLEWTSLPVGGESTHCVLSGHRGLPSAKLFTNLDKIVEGDVFILRVLDEILTYEVDQILIVEPNVTDALRIEEGKDYCTLVTCTPYGINTHRMLVRGHRIENAPEARIVLLTADAAQIEPMLVAPIIGMPIVLILMIPLMLPRRHRYR
jgi:sortase A